MLLPAGDAIVKQLEQLRCGEIYWSYFSSLLLKAIPGNNVRKLLIRKK
jgi:hypothetical protein